jgi:cell division protein FtsZ
MGKAMMGTGEASGEGRAVRAAEEAITNPLLDDVSLAGARGLLLSITGGSDLTLYEVDEAATRVRQEVDPDANIIVGATTDPSLGDRVRVSIVASGMDRSTREQSHSGHALPPVLPAEPAPPHPAAISDHERMATALRPSSAYDELTRPSFAPPPTVAAQHPAPHGPSWHTADDIEITELTPGASATPHPHPSAPPAPPYAVQPPHQDFVPAPPAQVRRPPRRMPELGDFPEIGQREYQAKMQRGGPIAAGPAQSSGSAPSPARKRGLLERLTGRAKRETDSQSSAPAERSPGASNPAAMDQSYTVGGGAPAHRTTAHHDGSDHQERPDLPAFFSKSHRK